MKTYNEIFNKIEDELCVINEDSVLVCQNRDRITCDLYRYMKNILEINFINVRIEYSIYG